MIDALDTLWFMDLKDDFKEAATWLERNMDFNKVTQTVSFFETTIRVLGGLISGYDLSGNEVFRKLAINLGDRCVRDSLASL